MLKGGAAVRASSGSAAEAAFELSLQMNSPGAVKFLVMYAKVYARFMDTYVVFDNTVSQLLRCTQTACDDCDGCGVPPHKLHTQACLP